MSEMKATGTEGATAPVIALKPVPPPRGSGELTDLDRGEGVEEAPKPGPWSAVRAGRDVNVPNPYRVDNQGVAIIKRARNKETGQMEVVGVTRIATAPILPVRILFAPDGEELIEITWWHAMYGRVVSEVVSRAVASKGRRLVEELRPKGFPVVDSDGPKVEKYLAEVESENVGLLATSRIARQLGWQPDGVFVAGDRRPRRVEPSYPREQRSALASHSIEGTLDGWRSAVAHAAPYPNVRATVSASFAAPLLEIVEGVPSFVFDLHSTSSGGKTTSAALGYSAWGRPTIERGGIAEWSSTRTAIQLRLGLCNGLPVVLDESKNVRTDEIVKQVIYDLPGGEAGGRAGDYYSKPITWETVVISTGERSLLAFTADAGAAARVVSVSGPPFGRDGEQSAAAADAAGDGVMHNYGHAGAAFVEAFTPEWRQWIQARHAELTAEHRTTGTDITRRRAPMVALLQVAEEAACRVGILPYEPMTTDQWQTLVQSAQGVDDPAERALEVVRSFVERNPYRVYTGSALDVPSMGWIAARGEQDGREVVALFREPLSDEFAKQGYELDAVRPHWLERGWLTVDPANPKHLVRRRIGKTRVRVYEFPADIFDGTD